MAAKEYQVAFEIAGKLGAGFKQAFDKAKESVGGMGDKLTEMNKKAAQVDKLIKLKEELKATGQATKNAMLRVKAMEELYAESSQKTNELAKAHASAQRQVTRLGNQISKVGVPTEKMSQEFSEAQAKADKLGKELAASQRETKGFERDVTKAKTSLDKTKAGFDKNRTAVNQYSKAIGESGTDMKTLIKRQKELAEASDKARAALEKQQKIQEKLAKASKLQEKANSVKGVGNGTIAAVGGAAAGAGGYMLKMGTEYQAAMNKMQAQTGVTRAEMADLEKTARSLYTSGMGESFENIAASMAQIRQATGLTGNELKKAANNGLLLSDTFDMDINESTRAASALAKNMGISYDKAYGLIAYGAQNGANKNGDLLDTFNEYSVHYKALGFSADQFTQHLVEGAKTGAFSIDKVGDAIKEFNIRSKDGSKQSIEAFEGLGINGKKVTSMFAKGGKEAQFAFYQVVDALDAMKDPVKKNEIGVALFGTQFEDLEAGALKTFKSMKNASVDAEGTIKKINDVRYDDLGSQLTVLGRKFNDSLIPVSKDSAATIKEQMPQIEAAFKRLQPVIASVTGVISANLPAIVDAVGMAITKVSDFATTIANSWSWLGPIVTGTVKAFLGLKVVAYLVSPLMTLYKGFLMFQSCLLKVRQSTILSTAATKAAAIAQRLWNSALSTSKLVAHKAALVAHKVATVAWSAACKAAALAQRAWNGAISVAKIVAQKAALLAHKAVMVAWSVACKAAAVAQKAFGAAMRFMTGPIGIAIAAIAGLIAVGVYLYKNWDTVKAKAVELWSTFASKFPGIAGFVQSAFNSMKPVISGLKTMLGGVISFVTGVFTGNWSRAWNGVKNIFGGAWEALKGLAAAPLNGVIALANKAIGALNGISVKIPDWVPKFGGRSFGVNIPKIPQLADGGIVSKPTLAMIGEGNESEAVVPLSKLAAMTTGGGAAANMTVTYSPVINVTGGAGNAYEDVRRAAADSLSDFERKLDQIMARRQRTSYA